MALPFCLRKTAFAFSSKGGLFGEHVGPYYILLPQGLTFKLFLVGFPTKND